MREHAINKKYCNLLTDKIICNPFPKIFECLKLNHVDVSAIPILTPRPPFNEPDEFVHAPLLVEFEAEVDVEVVDDDLVAVPTTTPPPPPPPPPVPLPPILFFEALRSANIISLI
uniref:Uncharacterized protein n=1 Tax=Glossina brevipalpis TaxID=37001 RepID=A0A1A9W1A6_9MUSC